MSAVKESGPKTISLRFEDFEVDLGTRTLKRAGLLIPLDQETFDLLTILLASAPEPVSEIGLVEFLWPGTPIEASNLGQHIFLLRRALGGTARGERIIVASGDQGYRFAAALESFEARESFEGQTAEPEEEALEADDRPLLIVNAEDSSEPLRSRPSLRKRSTTSYREERKPARQPFIARPGTSVAAQLTAIRHYKRLSLLLISAAVLLVAAVVLILLWPRFHAKATPPLHLVVAGIQNATTDPEFDEALRAAITADLRQSPHLILPSDASIVAALVKLNITLATTPTESTQPTRAIPQNLCRELKSDAYLTGELRHLGMKYLLVLSIHSCVSSQELATARGIADSPQHLIGILDRAALALREQLGESSKTLKSFRQPLFADSDASMPALKAYAEGVSLTLDNKRDDAIPLLRRAISIDRHFPLAEEALGLLQLATGEHAEGAAHLTRAYQLRNSANAYDRFQIEDQYQELITGDLAAAIRNAREAVESYPASSAFLIRLADLEDRTGKSTFALDPARKALALDPNNSTAYEVLASSQMHLGQFDEAALTCRHAISRSIDTAKLHSILLQIAFQRLDQPAIDEQIAWAQGKPAEAVILADQGWMELAEGRAKSAQRLFSRAITAFREQGSDEEADRLQAAMPRRFAELGLTATANALLSKVKQQADPEVAVAWAELGEPDRASQVIDEAVAAHPAGSLLQQAQAPQVHALIALKEDNPQQALDALQAAAAYDRASFDLPLMRGRALLAQNRNEEAEAEFHKVLDHPGIDPLSVDYPLAQLGVAHALAGEGKATDAAFAYKIVLAIWKDGDGDLPRFREAQAEYDRLSRGAAVELSPFRRR